MRRLALLLPLAIAAACATVPPPSRVESPVQATQRRAKAPRPAYNLAGYPPAAREGYIDGCESAKRSSYAHKDAKRMAEDPQYSMGWNDGFSICKR
jgi:hypothetical protein